MEWAKFGSNMLALNQIKTNFPMNTSYYVKTLSETDTGFNAEGKE